MEIGRSLARSGSCGTLSHHEIRKNSASSFSERGLSEHRRWRACHPIGGDGLETGELVCPFINGDERHVAFAAAQAEMVAGNAGGYSGSSETHASTMGRGDSQSLRRCSTTDLDDLALINRTGVAE